MSKQRGIHHTLAVQLKPTRWETWRNSLNVQSGLVILKAVVSSAAVVLSFLRQREESEVDKRRHVIISTLLSGPCTLEGPWGFPVGWDVVTLILIKTTWCHSFPVWRISIKVKVADMSQQPLSWFHSSCLCCLQSSSMTAVKQKACCVIGRTFRVNKEEQQFTIQL